jgi:hypothetical protein
MGDGVLNRQSLIDSIYKALSEASPKDMLFFQRRKLARLVADEIVRVNSTQTAKKPKAIFENAILPPGTIVYEMGQNPVHCLWFAHIVSLDDILSKRPVRFGWAEEFDSMEEALAAAIEQYNIGVSFHQQIA